MSKSHFFKHLTYTFSRGAISHSSPFLALSNSKPPLRGPVSFPNNKHSSLSTVSALNCSSTATTTAAASPSYLSVRVRCPENSADTLAEALLCFGASSVIWDGEANRLQEVYIDSIFTGCQDVRACISQAADSIGLKEVPSYVVEAGEEYDWVQKTQESFHPVEVSEGLWIVPEWRSPPDPQATNIILNPGLAFGTGEHATTKLCLSLLRGLIKEGDAFLDYGTGSGILAIAALKFGAARSVGFDIDSQSITSAQQNAALNGIDAHRMQLQLLPDNTKFDKVTQEHGDVTGLISERGIYDVVVANILLNPLLELADVIVSYAKPGAVVGLSGIISEQLSYVMERYSMLLDDISVVELDDWVCVSGKKKKKIL